MSDISRDDVVAVFGPLDDVAVAEIIATGATREDLAAARAWIVKDRAGTNTERFLPDGPVGHVIEIVERIPLARSLLGDAGSTLQ